MIYSIIQKSQLEGAERLDSEYYQPEYLSLFKNLNKNDVTTLGSISEKITQGPNPTFLDKGQVSLNGRNIKNNRVDTQDSNYVSEDEFERFQNFKVKKGDILITLKGLGSIGKTGFVFEELNAIFSRDIGLIRVKDNYEFVYAFLLSKYGVLQIERSTTGGTGQLTLTTNYIKQFKIPKFNSDQVFEITSKIQGSESEYSSSINLYAQAENLLLRELGLDNFKPRDDLSYVVNMSEVEEASRVDADFFQPRYKELIEIINKNKAQPFSSLIVMKKGFEPGSDAYEEEGRLFIRVSSVSKFGIEENDQKYLSEELYRRLKKNYEPQVDEILLTKDATPGIAYVIEDPVEGIISSGILRLKVKDTIETEYLALCINSIIGKWQAEQDAGGSIIAHWRPEQIGNIKIPILSVEKQQEIAELVKKSHEAGKKSKELLEEAKKKVEEMIERGGEN